LFEIADVAGEAFYLREIVGGDEHGRLGSTFEPSLNQLISLQRIEIACFGGQLEGSPFIGGNSDLAV